MDIDSIAFSLRIVSFLVAVVGVAFQLFIVMEAATDSYVVEHSEIVYKDRQLLASVLLSTSLVLLGAQLLLLISTIAVITQAVGPLTIMMSSLRLLMVVLMSFNSICIRTARYRLTRLWYDETSARNTT